MIAFRSCIHLPLNLPASTYRFAFESTYPFCLHMDHNTALGFGISSCHFRLSVSFHHSGLLSSFHSRFKHTLDGPGLCIPTFFTTLLWSRLVSSSVVLSAGFISSSTSSTSSTSFLHTSTTGFVHCVVVLWPASSIVLVRFSLWFGFVRFCRLLGSLRVHSGKGVVVLCSIRVWRECPFGLAFILCLCSIRVLVHSTSCWFRFIHDFHRPNKLRRVYLVSCFKFL